MENTAEIYAKLQKELEQLPAGYISRKNIKGKVQYYLQWRENGKKEKTRGGSRTTQAYASEEGGRQHEL